MWLFRHAIHLLWSLLPLSSGLLLSQISLIPWCSQAIYLYVPFLKNYLIKIVDKKAHHSTIPVKLHSSPSQQELNDVLQISTGIYMHMQIHAPSCPRMVLRWRGQYQLTSVSFWLKTLGWSLLLCLYGCWILTLQEEQIVLLTSTLIRCSVHW